ncbi:MAG: AI-2E family transporter [Actinomycetales bacterium]|nr:AI-2E family transporter [Actinomycetales bacterium]
MAKRNDAIDPLRRPPAPQPYPTPDAVSMQFRRIGGYAWRLIAIGVVVWGLVILVKPLQTLMMALFFALLTAAWLMPLTNLLARKLPRPLAAVLSLLAFVLAIALVLVFIGVQAVNQWDGIGRALTDGVESLNLWLQQGPLGMPEADVSSAYQSAVTFIQSSGGNIALGVLSGLSSIVSLATAAAAALFVLLFLLIEPHRMFGWTVRWMPARNREVIGSSIRIGWMAFSQYSVGVLLVALSNAIVVTIALLIMGVPLAIPLGVIVFFGAFIPYIGAPVAMLLAAFVALVTDGVLAGTIVIVLIFVIGQLEGNVLQPLIMGKSVNLHPVSIVLVTAIFAAYFGLLGALVGVPITASIYGVMKYLRAPIDPSPDDALPDDALQ